MPNPFQILKDLRKHHGFRRYFENTSWLFTHRAFNIITNLFVGIWIARYLGPESYGILAYSVAIVSIFNAIAKLGLDNILKRELTANPKKYTQFLGTAFWLKVIGAALSMLLLAFVLPFSSSDPSTKFMVSFIAISMFFNTSEVIDFYYQSQVKAKFTTFSKISALCISSLAKIVLILIQAPLLWFVIAIVFTAMIQALFFWGMYIRQKYELFLLKFNKDLAKTMLKDSWPLIFTGMSLMLQAKVDQIMLKEMLGSEIVGHYSVSLRIVEALALFSVIANNSLMPAIVSAKERSQELYKNRLLNFYRLHFILCLLVTIPLALLAKPIILVLFGDAYVAAIIILTVMSARLFFAHMGAARNAFLITENLTKFALFTMVMGTIVNILANLILIPEYAAVGAVIATIISFFFTTFVFDIIYTKTRGNVLLQFQGILTFYKLNLGEKNGSA